MWKKTDVPIEKLPDIIKQLNLAIANGDNILEQMMCIYKLENSAVMYLRTPWDFIDDMKQLKPIKEFYLYTSQSK